MSDRCDADTKSIIDAALGESRRRGHSWLGTEHVLLALAQRRDLLGPEVLRSSRTPKPSAPLWTKRSTDHLAATPSCSERSASTSNQSDRRYGARSATARSRTSAAGGSTNSCSRGGVRRDGACRSSPGP